MADRLCKLRAFKMPIAYQGKRDRGRMFNKNNNTSTNTNTNATTNTNTNTNTRMQDILRPDQQQCSNYKFLLFSFTKFRNIRLVWWVFIINKCILQLREKQHAKININNVDGKKLPDNCTSILFITFSVRWVEPEMNWEEIETETETKTRWDGNKSWNPIVTGQINPENVPNRTYWFFSACI